MRPARPHPRTRNGFSLLELSIVMAIVSVVAVMGLESAALYMNRTAYSTTKEKLTVIKAAMEKHRFVYGYLPCPARAVGTSDASYGKEYRVGSDCGTTLMTGVYYGLIPVRDLNLPLGFMKDGYGSEMNYIVSANLNKPGTAAGQFSNGASAGAISVRTGRIQQPCSTVCQTIADAAYMIFSPGADKRGASATQCLPNANTVIDGMIDTVNCRFGGATKVRINGSGSQVTIPNNVFYDSRFNNGRVEQMHFDDLVIWQTKGQL